MSVDASGLSPLGSTRDEEAVRRVVQDAFENRDRGWSPEIRARVARDLQLGENPDPILDALFASAVALVRATLRGDDAAFAAFAAVAPLAASAASAAATRWRDEAARAPVPAAPRLLDVDWSVRATANASDIGAQRATATITLTVEAAETNRRARMDGSSPPTERVAVELDADQLAAVVETLAGVREQLAAAAGRQ